MSRNDLYHSTSLPNNPCLVTPIPFYASFYKVWIIGEGRNQIRLMEEILANVCACTIYVSGMVKMKKGK